MRTTVSISSALLGVFAMACSSGDHGSTTGAGSTTASTSTAAAAVSATATATAVKTAAATRPARKAPKSFDALKEELKKKCPVADAPNNLEQKAAFARSIECLRKKMIADLDGVLVPLKTSDEAKFKTLMKEQADWNRMIEEACQLEEERFWVDFETGQRDDGTYRSYPYLGCLSKAYSERILYARALGAAKIEPLSKRIEEVQKDGAVVKAKIADIVAKSTAFEKAPPKVEEGAMAPDWKTIKEDAGKLAAAAASLSQSTCTSWPDLAKALGGKEKCGTKAELYYYVQGNVPEVTAE